MQYCSLQHRILLLSPVTSTAGYCFCFGSIPSFFLELYLHWSPVAYWASTDLGKFLFHYPIILPFHTVHEVLKARILKWFAIPFSSGPHSVRPLHHDLPLLGGPIGHKVSFIELDKAVVPVIRLTSFLWLWFHCLPSDALSQHLPSYLGFSYLGLGVSLHSCSSKVQPLLLTLDEGYLLMATPPDLMLMTAAAAKSLQSCPTLCDPIDDSPPGSPVPGILQARTLEWVAISFSNAWKWKVKVKSLSCVRLFATLWTEAVVNQGGKRIDWFFTTQTRIPPEALTCGFKTLT